MANSPQARKRARQAEDRRKLNTSQRSMMRTYVKKVAVAIDAGDAESARSALRAAEPMMDRMARKGLVHKNKVARDKRKLVGRIKALATPPAPSA